MNGGDADPRKLAIVLGLILLIATVVAVALFARMVWSVGMPDPK
jgi:hypothetical protein